MSDLKNLPSKVLPGTDLTITPRHLLIVEDHLSTAMVMQRLLQRHGHQVWVAFSCVEALQMAQMHSIEVVICDLDLPDGNGCDLLKNLMKAGPIHGIMLTGHGAAEDLQRSRAAGFAAHLVKPFDIAQIELTLARILPLET